MLKQIPSILLKLLGDAMPLGFEQDSLHSGFLARGAQKLNSRKDDTAQCAADIQMAQFRADCVVDDHEIGRAHV